jgi:uncharacterized protein YprB with RNaseH-like and TPR domain
MSINKKQPKTNYEKLELLIPGEIINSGAGDLYLVSPNVDKLCTDAEILNQRYLSIFDTTEFNKVNHDLKTLLNANPEDIVFLDIETTGLSNTPLFLIGLLYFDGDKIIIRQLFARDYSEEANLLHYFTEITPKFKALVTFNGKSFDVPFIRDRMIYHRKFLKWSHTHVDILHHSRRRWKGKFPDCKLQTLEYFVCSRRRENDVPSALVPEIYHDFVRNGNPEYLSGVFYHNALDLITLMELTLVLLSQEEK